ncbi:NHLP bacteriocin system secretion protein [Desulfolutivibrio sulfoxidireducens]|uniref:NHLP bacteriocin system secretion protein n=1 Tax=Desulfolutivibrio sulfoxidireducens TaxID=2773299 RepID=UPI00159DF9FA|nr:NHLP bacteriocin system secretion protein [Desulfolutivibrio sulfoxidireducens]QLA19103.1 NHLP bacteriocin system secretion protein [Desulfolutivibrio sulfoxidireducens]
MDNTAPEPAATPAGEKSGRGRKRHPYRKSCPADLSSPRELDIAVRVVVPRDWILLTALGIIIAASLGWGFFGEVTTKVRGLGIIIKPGALFDVISTSQGQVIEVYVKENDAVAPGQLVARVQQPELANQVREAEKMLEKLNEEMAFIERFQSENATLGLKYLDKQRQTLEDAVRLGRERVMALEERVRVFEDLLARGLTTRTELDNQKNEYRKALLDVMRAGEELSKLFVSRLDVDARKTRDLLNVLEKQVPAKERLAALKEKLALDSEIHSLHGGRVIEIYKDPGDMIQKGQAVFTMEITEEERLPLHPGDDDDPVVVAYIPPFQGMEIDAGMPMQIVPAVVKKEEYGVMLGDVTDVSQYPASRQGMVRILQYEELADRLTEDGAPILIQGTLRKNPKTPSGFSWSSGEGPPIQIKSGTLCAVEVVAETQRPIDLLIPYLNKHLLGVGDTAPGAGR